MTNAIPRLMTAVAAAAFLSLSPVAAQVEGGAAGVVPEFELDQRVSPDARSDLHQRFYGSPMPQAAEVRPVPEEIAEAYPEMAGYDYFALPGDRFILVNPDTGNIAMVVDPPA
jgi:hypothetical protein